MKPPIVLILLALIRFCTAAACNHDNILRALLQSPTDASSFCATYLGHSTLSTSVILFGVTIVGGTSTQTYGPSEIATLFKAFSKTISTKTVTTSYRSQVPARTASSTQFSLPTPVSYVATYPVSQISSACSCLSVPVQNIPVNVNCDNVPTLYVSTDTITEFTVFTAAGGESTTTLKVTNTITIVTSIQTVILPFPTVCPALALAQYIGVDGSPWFRSCTDSWGGQGLLSSGIATSLDNCIDQCITNNQRAKYTQCVAVALTLPTAAHAIS